ncbi:hypothetical protein K502DRAFT_324910, partial [Neoconidiobolus thromboides FSU 785]
MAHLRDVVEMEMENDKKSFHFTNPNFDLLTKLVTIGERNLKEYSSSSYLEFYLDQLNIDIEDEPQDVEQDFDEVEYVLLLDALDTSDKGNFTLHRDDFCFLKQITAKLQSSLITPSCNHSSKHFKTPDEVKVSVDRYHTYLRSFVPKLTSDWDAISKEAFNFTFSYFDTITRIDQTRVNQLVKGNRVSSYNYADTFSHAHFGYFTDNWSKGIEKFRQAEKNRKKGEEIANPVKYVEKIIDDYLEILTTTHRSFASCIRSELQVLTAVIHEVVEASQRLLASSKDRFRKLKNNEKYESARKKMAGYKVNAITSVNLLNGLKKMDFFDELLKLDSLTEAESLLSDEYFSCGEAYKDAYRQARIKSNAILSELSKRNVVYNNLKEEIEKSWKDPSLKTVAARIERATNKEFRKQFKRLEVHHATFRMYALDQFNMILSMDKLADYILSTTDALVEEAQLSFSILLMESYSRVFDPHIFRLGNDRRSIVDELEIGIKEGREMLSVIIGKFLLREGFKELEKYIALEKQNQLLKQWDLDDTNGKKDVGDQLGTNDGKKKNKKKNKKKKAEEAENSSISSPITESPAQNNSPALEHSPPPKPVTIIKNLENTPKNTDVKKDEVNRTNVPSKLYKDSNSTPLNHVNNNTVGNKVSSSQQESNTVETLDPIKELTNYNERKEEGEELTNGTNPHSKSFELDTILGVFGEDQQLINNINRLSGNSGKTDRDMFAALSKGIKSYIVEKICEMESGISLKDAAEAMNSMNINETIQYDTDEAEATLSRTYKSRMFFLTDIADYARYPEKLDHLSKEAIISLILPVISVRAQFKDMIDKFTMHGTLMNERFKKLNQESIQQQQVIKAQAEEINQYRKAILQRDSQLISLVQQQATLLNVVSRIPVLKERLDSIYNSPNHPLNDKLPMKILEGLDIPGFDLSLVPDETIGETKEKEQSTETPIIKQQPQSQPKTPKSKSKRA